MPSVGNFRKGMLVSVPLHLDTLPGKPKVAGPRGRARQALCRREVGEGVKVDPAVKDQRIDALALNDTNLMELRVFGSEKHRARGAGRAARQPRQGRLGRGRAEHRLDARRRDLTPDASFYRRRLRLHGSPPRGDGSRLLGAVPFLEGPAPDCATCSSLCRCSKIGEVAAGDGLTGLQQRAAHGLGERAAEADAAHARVGDLAEAQAGRTKSDHMIDRRTDGSANCCTAARSGRAGTYRTSAPSASNAFSRRRASSSHRRVRRSVGSRRQHDVVLSRRGDCCGNARDGIVEFADRRRGIRLSILDREPGESGFGGEPHGFANAVRTCQRSSPHCRSMTGRWVEATISAAWPKASSRSTSSVMSVLPFEKA